MICLCFQFIQVLQRELNQVEKEKDAFVSEFSQVSVSIILINLGFIFMIFVSFTNGSYSFFFTLNIQKDYDDIVDGWKAKLIRSSSGEQRWGLFIANKN